MIRLLLPLLGKLTLLFALVLGAIRTQPRDDAAIRALLAAPEDCPAPCFLGIRPGETTREQAMALLRALPWIDGLEDDATSVSWRGREPLPRLGSLGDGTPSTLILAHVNFYAGIVRSIHVETTVKWGDFLVLFGKADQIMMQTVNAPTVRFLIFNAIYTDHDFEVQTLTRCPITSPQAMWYSTVYVVWPIARLTRGDQVNQAQRC